MGSIELVVSLIVGLVTIGTSLYALIKLWRGRLHVVRFVTEEDDYFDEAMRLYERNFDDWERDEPEEIERWLREGQTRRSIGDKSLEEYLLAAIWRQKPCGFFYGTFYESKSTLFVSYLVVDRGLDERISSRVSKELFERVREELTADGYELKGVAAEVEVPDTASSTRMRERRKARIRRLLQMAKKSGVPLRILDAPYLQPKLDLRDKDKHEDSLVLLYARVHDEMPKALPRGDVIELFRFIYDELYGDCFMENETQDEEWRRYTADLRERAVSRLPESVRCLSRYRDMSQVIEAAPKMMEIDPLQSVVH